MLIAVSLKTPIQTPMKVRGETSLSIARDLVTTALTDGDPAAAMGIVEATGLEAVAVGRVVEGGGLDAALGAVLGVVLGVARAPSGVGGMEPPTSMLSTAARDCKQRR